MLGGSLARKGDGEPDVKTIWIGLRRVMDFAAGLRLMRDPGDGASCVKRHGPDDTLHQGARRSQTSRLLKALPHARRMLL